MSSTNYDKPVVLQKPKQKALNAGIGKRYENVTFQSIKKRGIPPQLKHHVIRAYEYAADIESNVDKGIGLFLKGGVGVLKTTLAVAVMQVAMQKYMQTKFIPMVSLIDKILSFKDNKERSDFEKQIQTVQILVLDDLGAEMPRDWIISKIDSIITERYNRMLPTIITTNLSHAELNERYNVRTMDRLNETSIVLNFEGTSLRKAVKK